MGASLKRVLPPSPSPPRTSVSTSSCPTSSTTESFVSTSPPRVSWTSSSRRAAVVSADHGGLLSTSTMTLLNQEPSMLLARAPAASCSTTHATAPSSSNSPSCQASHVASSSTCCPQHTSLPDSRRCFLSALLMVLLSTSTMLSLGLLSDLMPLVPTPLGILSSDPRPLALPELQRTFSCQVSMRTPLSSSRTPLEPSSPSSLTRRSTMPTG